MNDKTLRLLEFDAIRERVASRCLSEEAAEVLRQETVSTDPEVVHRLKSLSSGFIDLIASGKSNPTFSFPSIGSLVPRLGKEGVSLELDEAYAIGLFVESATILVKWLSSPEAADVLRQETASIPDCSVVSSEIFKIIDRDGNMRDLPELREIKRRIKALRRDLEAITNRYFGDDETRRMLQSDVATQRDGRMVLAVKANYRGRLKGIVHEVSATGQTIFVEPEDVVEKNNDIVIEERRLASETARILREMTARIGVHRESLESLRERVLFIDRIRARARYGIDTNAVFAPDPSGRLELRRARHPLLGSSAVPIDISMDEGTRIVIVTGPNTGGKTVALKTVGLFSLMNQFGLPVPAAEGTTLPVFDSIFADIGDEQSISQSLSTFSAHMTNIASICAGAGQGSLVLLDELGSGTDPEEGSAIAMSILDHFIQKSSRVLVTTHHGILKNYGYTKSGVVNASVDFDSKTLSPTYRIVLGIPGESHALDIASRNGLAADIVERARSYLDEERADVSALIIGLRSKHKELEAAENSRKMIEKALIEDRRKNDLRELRLRQKELELKTSDLGALKRLLNESRKTLENLVRELREGELTREKTSGVKDFLAELERTVSLEQRTLAAESDDFDAQTARIRSEEIVSRKEATKAGQSGTAAPVKISEGVRVLAGPSRREGVVVRSAKKGSWVVQIGAMKMTLHERDLCPLAIDNGPARVEIALADLVDGGSPSFELNLIGKRVEEALAALRHQIDAAAMSGLFEFSIIHGKGDGILQRAVHDFLKDQKVVEDWQFARPEEGGSGKTQVRLRK